MRRPVGRWLLVMAVLVVIQVILGCITRLTDSGLSITEWQPILGVVPPLNHEAWERAFGQYQLIPQFRALNAQLTLEAFKHLYFWEWFHRLWARMLGFAFVLPMLRFWRQRRLDGLWPRLTVIFALGALQGVMGWVMVASGLQDLVYVSHFRLAAHFMLAMVLLVSLVWVGLGQLRPAASRGGPAKLMRGTRVLIGLLGLQLVFGTFMAGLKAAVFAPSWPTINGSWVPAFDASWWNSPLVVHFAHRNFAYLLALAVVTWWWQTRGVLKSERHLGLALVLMQVLLGITVTVRSMYRDELLVFGVLHQLTAVLLLLVLVGALFRLTPADAQRPVPC